MVIIRTSEGIWTWLDWWQHFHVQGDSVVLSADDGELSASSLVVASLPSAEEAEAMWLVIHHAIVKGARCFDARDWPSVAGNERNEDAGKETGR